MKILALSFLIQDIAEDQQKTAEEVRQELCKASGIPEDRIIKLEAATNDGTPPKFGIEEIVTVSEFLGVKVDDLFNPRYCHVVVCAPGGVYAVPGAAGRW